MAGSGLKRALALAACVLCFGSMAATQVLAASKNNTRAANNNTATSDNEVEIVYVGNEHGGNYQAFVLIGNPIRVRMDLGDYDMPSDTTASRALVATQDEAVPGAGYDIAINGTRVANEYTVQVNTQPAAAERYELSGNLSSVTPKNGYKGTVAAGGTTGSATLGTSRAISQESVLVINCDAGESPLSSYPQFSIDTGKTTGYFQQYIGGSVELDLDASDLNTDPETGSTRPYVSGKDLVFNLTKPGLTPLTISFRQGPRYDYIVDAMDNTKYLEANGSECADQTKPTRVTNNYVRKDESYTITFTPPRTNQLLLTVATPQYVADVIAGNMEEDKREGADRQYVKLATGDTFELVRGGLTLTVKDKRYNDTFHIRWSWKPLDAADQSAGVDMARAAEAVVIPTNQNNTEDMSVPAKVNRQEEDVKGILTGEVMYGGNLLSKVEYELLIYGTGVKATVVPESQKVATSTDPDSPAVPAKLPSQIQMDVFQGGIEEYKKNPSNPFEYVLQLNMGLKNAKSTYAVVTVTTTEGRDVVELRTRKDGMDTPYSPGSQIENPYDAADYPTQGTALLVLTARSPGRAVVKVDFYIKVGNKVEIDSTHEVELVVTDSSPSRDSSLSGLLVRSRDKKETFTFGFDPEKLSYQDPILLPYAYEDYLITPTVNEPRAAETPIEVSARDMMGAPAPILDGKEATQIASGRDLKISLPVTSKVYELTFTVQAQDPRVTSEYVIFVQRAEPSDDDSLASLGLYYEEDTNGANNLIKGFAADNRGPYIVTVPYDTEVLRVAASQSFARAKVAYTPPLTKLNLLGRTEYLKLADCQLLSECDQRTQQAAAAALGTGWEDLLYFRVALTPEVNLSSDGGSDGPATGFYEVYIQRLPPSKESRLKGMEIVDAADTAPTPKALTYAPAFGADNPGPYRLTDANAVPYAVEAVRFKITPQDEKITAVRIYNADKTQLLTTITNPAVYSEPVPLKPKTADLLYNEFVVQVVAESGKGKPAPDTEDVTEYRVQIEREQASTDADLLSVILAAEGGEQIKSFAFHRDETQYSITVPYDTRAVTFNPHLSQAGASIQLRDSGNVLHTTGVSLDKLTPDQVSKNYKLNDPGSPRSFALIVTAQDGKTQKTYTFTIDREPPSTDAQLKGLVLGGITEDGLSPIFKPSEGAYSAVVAEGAQGVTVTATVNEPHASIMVGFLDKDGKLVGGQVVESGSPSPLIELLEENSKLGVVVTAQDGKTTRTYAVDLFNQNLVDKTNNADLSQLRVERGSMTPAFKAAVTDYEVAVKEDTWSVDIIPQVADPLAEVKVLAGTRELGDYNGNYALALQDGENPVTVQVTSPDKSQTKEYKVSIYRNQEDELKYLTPLKAEDVNFETDENPIIISIAEYPRVQSDVFAALKQHPEKTIIFQGNDYSLTFNAANLNELIPQRQIYDFQMSFSSPDAEKIRAYMGQWDANLAVIGDMVMVYFDYHGDLPGIAALNLSLGGKYANQYLFWHHYNRERDRIDYLGPVRSNSQGAFTVAVNHFSTYLVTRNQRITGSEDRSAIQISLNNSLAGGKQNPNTGVSAAAGDGPDKAGGGQP